MSKLSFSVEHSNLSSPSDGDRSRVGTLSTIPTPTFALSSRRCGPLNLTYKAVREVIGEDTPYLLNVPLGDVCLDHGKRSVTGSESSESVAIRKFVGEKNIDANVRLYLGYRDSLSMGPKKLPKSEEDLKSTNVADCFQEEIVKTKNTSTTTITNGTVTSKDSNVTVNDTEKIDASNKQKSKRSTKNVQNLNQSLPLERTINGRQKLADPERTVANFGDSLGFDLAAQPSEEIDSNAGKNRSQRAGERCLDALDRINGPTPTLAAIQGGAYAIQRRLYSAGAADAVRKSSGTISGYIIGGCGLCETIPDRRKILGGVAKHLDSDAPRFLPLSLGSPLEVMDACLAGGIDVFEICFPFEMANQGVALTFETEMVATHVCVDSEIPAEKKTPWALNLNNIEYAADFTTIDVSIQRDSFKNKSCPRETYTKAYLHHLLTLNELLSTIVLSRHNLRKYWDLFREIRRHIAAGTLPKYRKLFVERHAGIATVNKQLDEFHLELMPGVTSDSAPCQEKTKRSLQELTRKEGVLDELVIDSEKKRLKIA